ncbi:M28 family peptidase [bacterium]|nr:M28 family peptidase [candidate division CSSED10-310 bacterium]
MKKMFIVLALLAPWWCFPIAAVGGELLLVDSFETWSSMEAAGNLVVVYRTDRYAVCRAEGDISISLVGLGAARQLAAYEELNSYFIVDLHDALPLLPSGASLVRVADSVFLLSCPTESLGAVTLGRAEVMRLNMRPREHIRQSVAGGNVMRGRDYDPVIQAMVDQVDDTDYLTVLTELVGFTTRNSYTQGCADATHYVYNAFDSYGLDASYHTHTSSMAPNVIGELPGLETPDQIYIICGHLDSTAGSPWNAEPVAPGADDNGTGSTAVLLAAEILSQYRFRSTIRFICFTGEEQGLYGSEAYADVAGIAGEDIRGVINYDMIGWVDPAPEDLDVICNQASSNFTDAFLDAAGMYSALPCLKVIDGSMSYSDHYHFWQNGYPAFCGIEDFWPGYPYYHTTQDTVDKVTISFASECTRAAVGAAATMAEPIAEDILYTAHVIDDAAGDGDGVIDPGETVNIIVTIQNFRLETSTNVQAQLTCLVGSQYIQLIDDSSSYGAIAAGAAADNSTDPFVLSALPQTPEDTLVTFLVTVTADGGYENTMGFGETVSSAIAVCPFFYEPFMNNPGWTISGGSWAFGQPTGQGGAYGGPDPTSGFTGSNVYGYNLNGDYTNSMPLYSLTSAPVDCGQYTDVSLRFKRWLGVEDDAYDHATVQVSNNGTVWTTVWTNGISDIYDGAWIDAEYDISAVADGSSTVYLRWTMGPTDSGWTYCGWNIDDVELCGNTYAQNTPAPTWTTSPTPSPTPLPPSPTPESTIVPSATPVRTQPPGPGAVTLRLIMNAAEYHGGQSLRLDCRIENGGTPHQVDLYIALDVYGQYFFYPGWNLMVDYRQLPLPTGTWQERILDLTLPLPLTPAGPFTFWSVLTEPETIEVVGNISFVSFVFI